MPSTISDMIRLGTTRVSSGQKVLAASTKRTPYKSPLEAQTTLTCSLQHYQGCEKQCFGAQHSSIPSPAPSVQCVPPSTMLPTITGHIRDCRTAFQGPSSVDGGTQCNGDHCFLTGEEWSRWILVATCQVHLDPHLNIFSFLNYSAVYYF